MIFVSSEHLTIGTSFSEGTDHYTIEDMVKECRYVLSTYFEGGHSNSELKEIEPERWYLVTSKLNRFILRYK